MGFLFAVLYAAAVGILMFVIGESLPRKWFHADRFPLRSWKWEKNGSVYDALKIQDWKDHVPDMSRVVKKMVPKRLGAAPSSQQVRELVQETCRAEIVHDILCLLSPPIYFFIGNVFGILLLVAYVLGNLAFVIIQRYNRPMLISLADRLEAREARRRYRAEHPEASDAPAAEPISKL